MKRPAPVNAESTFEFHEMFFSTTDLRGVIRYGNDVFVRVSNYPREKLIAAPHSIIRHPDMPRAVFKILWDTIQAGQPIVAYVKNLAADGHYYWVLAFVFPLEGGYLSIRVRPSSKLFQAVQGIYAQTLAVENEKGLDDSLPFLIQQVLAAGFSSYQDFMVKAAISELNIIEHKKEQDGTASISKNAASSHITEISAKASHDLKSCFDRMQSLQEASKKFVSTAGKLTEAFQHLKFIALNMTISAAKFGEDAASLGVVAKEFSTLSAQIQEHLQGLSEFSVNLAQVVERCAVKIVALETQMMMVDFFIHESLEKMATSQNAFADMVDNRDNFSVLFRDYTKGLSDEVHALEKSFSSILAQMSDVRKFTTGLEVIRQIGAVESARENEMKITFVHYLDEMRKFILLLQTSTHDIQKELESQKGSAKLMVEISSRLAPQVDEIFNLAANEKETASTAG